MRKFVTVSRRNASHKFVDLYIRSVQSLRFIVVRPGPGNQFPLNRATELRVPIVQIPAAEGWDARRTDENFQLDTDAVSKLKPLALCFVQTQIRCVSISAVARALQHYRSKESRKFLFEGEKCDRMHDERETFAIRWIYKFVREFWSYVVEYEELE